MMKCCLLGAMVITTALVNLGCDLIYPFTPPDAAGADLDDSVHTDEQGAPDATSACSIDGKRHEPMAIDSSDPCRMCDPVVSRFQWSAAPGCVVTLAGSGNQGFVDGPALSAELDGPLSVETDGNGRIFVADWSAHAVRMIWEGQVSTVAGNGSPGHVDGPAASSQLDAPMGLAVDDAGMLYISEKNGHRIRLLHKGQVSTVAGNSDQAHVDGPAASASFDSPQGLAVGHSETLYVADSGNNRVRQIVNGIVSTLCGSSAGWADGPAISARLSFPTGVEVGPSGAVFVADEENQVIRRVANGQVTTLAGVPGEGWFVDGPAASAKFLAPHDVAVDTSGAVYVADCGNSRIRKIEDGQVTTVAGGIYGFADGPFVSAKFSCPVSIDLDRSGHLYVTDVQNHRIRVLNLNQ